MFPPKLMLNHSTQCAKNGISNFFFRNLASAAKSTSYKVLVIGGGSAGISVSATIASKFGKGEIAIVEPSPIHNYQPLWTFVGAGLKPLAESQKPTPEVIPNGVDWVQNYVKFIDPDTNKVTLNDGSQLGYEYLVVAPGIELQWDRIQGLRETLGKNGVASNYSVDTVEKTWEYLQTLKSGKAVFTMPSTPIKCAGAPQKIVYLAEHYFTEKSRREKIDVNFYTGMGKIFAIEKYAKQLTQICQDRNINVHTSHDLVKVDGPNRVATFQKVGSGELVTTNFDMLHVTPKMGPYAFVRESKLSNSDGWVDVDPATLVHRRFHNVFSLGDASSCPTSRTAAAITSQSGVVSSNLLATIEHLKSSSQISSLTSKLAHYEGYTSCPLLVGDKKLILAEFNGYTGQPMETFPFDQSKPSRFSYELTSSVLPTLYWQGLLKGLWHGPEKVRKLLRSR